MNKEFEYKKLPDGNPIYSFLIETRFIAHDAEELPFYLFGELQTNNDLWDYRKCFDLKDRVIWSPYIPLEKT